jgi:hypothetical protein
MTSLLDIAPARVEVEIRGESVPVNGLTVEQIADVLAQAPALRKIMSGGMNGIDEKTLMQIPSAIGPIIAAGMGNSGNRKEAEAASKNLVAEEQMRLLKAILSLTMPNGVVPFVQSLTDLFNVVGGPDGKALVTS